MLMNVAKLASGAIGGSIVTLLCMPIVTRLYTPEMFGEFAFALSIALILFPFSTLRFNSAIVLPDEEDVSRSLFWLSLLSVLVVLLFLSVFLIILFASGLLDRSRNLLLSCLVILTVGSLGIQQTAQFWSLRRNEFSNIGWSKLLEAIVDKGIVIVAAVSYVPTTIYLMSGRFFGVLSSAVLLLYWSFLGSEYSPFAFPGWAKIKSAFIRFKEYSLFASLSFFVSPLSREFPIWVITLQYGVFITGMYALGQRVVHIPSQIIGDALSKAYLQKSAQDRGNQLAIYSQAKLLLSILLYVLLPIMSILVIFGQTIFRGVFGDGWVEAGLYVEILSPLLGAMFLYRVFSVLFDAFEKQKQRFTTELTLFLIRVLALGLPASMGAPINEAITIFSFVSTVSYLTAVVALLNIANVSMIESLKIALKSLLLSAPYILAMILISFQSGLSLIWLLALALSATAVQSIFVAVVEKEAILSFWG